MDSLDMMRVFVLVAEQGSFTRAATQLKVPKASATLAVQRLESQLKTQLLHRTTRRVSLTPDGELYYQRCLSLLADADEMNTLFLQPEALSGPIRVGMPLRLATTLFLPALSEFTQRYPELSIELFATDRRTDLVAEGYDCLVRVGTLNDSNYIARSVGVMRLVTCASPAYLAQHGEPKTLEDIAQHTQIHYAATAGSTPEGWEYWDGQQYQQIALRGGLTVNNSDTYLHACLQGFGLIQVPFVGVRRQLETGELHAIMQAYEAEPMPVSLLYPHRKHIPRRVQVFMDWLTEQLHHYLAPSDADATNITK